MASALDGVQSIALDAEPLRHTRPEIFFGAEFGPGSMPDVRAARTLSGQSADPR
jgi:hypothetical protein